MGNLDIAYASGSELAYIAFDKQANWGLDLYRWLSKIHPDVASGTVHAINRVGASAPLGEAAALTAGLAAPVGKVVDHGAKRLVREISGRNRLAKEGLPGVPQTPIHLVTNKKQQMAQLKRLERDAINRYGDRAVKRYEDNFEGIAEGLMRY
jgi:hypothetical protein